MAILNSDGSQADVQAKINAASPGDTVTLPSGTFTWTTGVSCAKGITISGNTTVTGTHVDGSTTPAVTVTPVVTDLTIIIDQNTTRDTPLLNTGGQPVTDTLRITGITFRHGTSPQTSGSNGGVVVGGNTSALNRVDQCHFDHLAYTQPVLIRATLGGVMDHCYSEVGSPIGNFTQTIQILNGGGSWGDDKWNDVSHFGTSNGFWFMEDCYFKFTQPNLGSGGGIDSYRGGKYVVRYTTLHNMQAQSHGTDSSGRIRGIRTAEIYNNIYLWDNGFSAYTGEFRGGAGLLHHNTFLNDNVSTVGVGAGSYRMWTGFPPWGAAFADPGRGNSIYDLNDVANHTGNGFGGGPSGLFASGTHTSANAVLSLTDANHTWATNQWVGYSVVKTTGTYNGGYVVSNDAHTMNFAPNQYNNNHLSFNTGDLYEVHKVIQVVDQAAGGKGDLLINNPPVDQLTGTATWCNQTIEPIYSWLNKDRNGTYVSVFPAQPNVVEGVSLFNQQAMPGYSPFTYPHPLVSGGATGKIISISGTGLNFGNVTIGQTPTGTLTVSNTGDTLLTVSSISYPTGFSGLTTGFTVAANASVNRTVTFTPLLAQLYSGNITVASDATSGSNTIGVSGTGINPVSPPSPHGHKRRPTSTFMT